MIFDATVVSYLVGVASGGLLLFLYTRRQSTIILRGQKERQRALQEAREQIEREKREALLKVREEIHKRRTESDLDNKRVKVDMQRLEHKTLQRAENLDKRERDLETVRRDLQHKERDISKKLDILTTDEIRMKKLYAELISKLERISGMSRQDARRVLTDSLQQEVKLESQKWVSKLSEETKNTAKEQSARILCTAMQRYLSEQVTMHSSSVVQLPNDEMKGRIIGKEGRNIKSLEMATGMEFVIGETPEVITIAGFNPVRREVAKRALTKLVQDGRINPTRIEEVVAKCESEVDTLIEEIGQQTVMEFGLPNIHSELISYIGKLHFRTSFTQNNLEHSKEVAYIARMIADELGLDGMLAARCGLLHDIGKALSAEIEGPHALVGGDLAKKFGEDPIVVNAISSHHEEVPAKTIYGIIVHLADAVSASRPGARKETLAFYIKRLEKLEEIAQKFDGVKKAYALQAGREVRIIVDENKIDDDTAGVLARDVAKKIEQEMNFPGQIKVNVIREKRIIEYAT
ncbi:ribonuclease Y [bacterium]|jgi:ribonucrease Y|nr:ribonuclease Y [bacterium]